MQAGDPRWRPTTEADLIQAAEALLLNEGGAGLEFKASVELTAGANKELARDLASLANDGGLLLVGINDEKARQPGEPRSALNPAVLHQLPERVEQIALMRCEPPLFVRCVAIPTENDPAVGYLAVHVPTSADAPHMVDGRYWGRGDRTKRPLTNADVVMLHARREQRQRDAAEPLAAYVARDPWLEHGQLQSLTHLFVVAEPRPGRPQMLLRHAPDDGRWQQWLVNMVQARANDTPRFGSGWSPDLDSAMQCSTRADGWAVTSYDFATGRDLLNPARESRLLEVEISEEGGLRLFCGRASHTPESNPDTALLFDHLVTGLVWRSLVLAGDLAAASGYLGQVALGVKLTNMRGAQSWAIADNIASVATPYPDDTYCQLASAGTEELQDAPGLVAERLLGRLLRTLGSYRHTRLAGFLAQTPTSAG